MEQNRKIEIPTGSSSILIDVINKFNNTYKTDFEFIESEDRDGVEFGIVKRGDKCSDNMVFMLGFFFGARVNDLRTKREIDW
jgi:hypothetical protein